MQHHLLAIDGNSLLYQAYHAFYKVGLTTKDGFPTGALKGFFTKFMELVRMEPDYVLVAFDVHAPTFRHERYADYKLGRKPADEDLLKQMPVVRELLREMGVAVVELERYEADDLLGTFSRLAEKSGVKTLIATGDRDSFQLINDFTDIYYTKENAILDAEAIRTRYGLVPDRMRDLKALMGDASDHIPGISGVGEKTALKLLGEYGSLEGVLSHAEELKGKLGERIRAGVEDARFSYWLGTIACDAPVSETLEDCRFDPVAMNGARKHFLELELRSIVQKMPEPTDLPLQQTKTVAVIPLTDDAGVEQVLAQHRNAKEIAVCSEPSLSFAFDPDTVYMLTCGDTLFDIGADETAAYCGILGLLQQGTELLAFDAKRLLHRMCADADSIPEVSFDAMIADYLLNSNRPIESFAALCSVRFDGVAPNAALLFPLRGEMEEELEEQGLTELYREMELKLLSVLYRMEQVGFLTDETVLLSLHDRFMQQAKELEARIYARAGEAFNILSPKQLGRILFEKLELPAQKKTKTGYSTDAEALEAIQSLDPIVPDVLSYRFLTKLDSTFVDGLLRQRDEDGRIRTRFMQCVTATGRLSSVEPNLQNIPVRTEEGREIRKAFIPSEGHVLIGADYSQIELRLLAHISEDEHLIRAFLAGEDIHRQTAAEVFHVPAEQVTAEQRSAAKAVNFGIVYGISDFGLSKNLNVSVYTAGSYIKRYLERFPKVEEYRKSSIQNAKEQGYALTMFKRRRPLPELLSANYNIRQFGERVAANMPIQGSAADIIKLAMIRVDAALQAEGLSARLVLQVHDELIVDAPKSEAERVVALMQTCMEQVVSLRVRLIAEAKIGESWYETK